MAIAVVETYIKGTSSCSRTKSVCLTRARRVGRGEETRAREEVSRSPTIGGL